jgi:hypothetical protein
MTIEAIEKCHFLMIFRVFIDRTEVLDFAILNQSIYH